MSGKQTEAARDHVVADEIDGVSWDELKKGKEFVKFPVSTQFFTLSVTYIHVCTLCCSCTVQRGLC